MYIGAENCGSRMRISISRTWEKSNAIYVMNNNFVI